MSGPGPTPTASETLRGFTEDELARRRHAGLLQLATPRERADFEISHTSVYWPKLDCGISSHCLLRGAKEARRFAERAWRKKAKLATAGTCQTVL